MQKEAIFEWANQKMGDADDSPLERGYRLHHGQRVAALATLLADRMHIDVDRDILYVGALLHDLGKSGGQPGKGHGERGAEITRDEISHLFFKEELNRVCSIVENHYMRPNNLRFEGREVPEFTDEVLLVQDADVLDHHGLFGVWLNMYWNAHERRSPSDAQQFYRQTELNLERLIRPLNYEISRIEFNARWARQQCFYAQLFEEGSGKLIHQNIQRV